ncbi:MAG: sigma 54-interacting transcriptional regulator [Deltaproteobacteria bacterium]|nr:sigma 54-interacting transcriptional regulator [Deltaproteobacteria bacterium]
MQQIRSHLEIETLYEISKTLSQTTDINKAFTSALNILSLYVGLENGTLALFDNVTHEVFVEAAPEMTDEERILGRLSPGEGLVGKIYALGVPVVVPDIAKEPAFLNRTGSWKNLKEDPRAFMGVPLRYGRNVLGVLTADRRHSNGPLNFDADIKLLTTIAYLMTSRVLLMQYETHHQDYGEEKEPQPNYTDERFPGIVCESKSMRDVLTLVMRVAKSRATVLLRGESGTGKELLARAIHDASPRAERSFIGINCAAMPESLIESELFGHDRGAFTGATNVRHGYFERADGGTLFLDEVGDLSLNAQAKLLRILQERQFERIGSEKPITVDVRVVAATNRNLEEMVRADKFRLDLYYRLSVISVTVPPLRERVDDITPLALHFLQALNTEHERNAVLTTDALELLRHCQLTGNARQLRNCIERALVASDHDELSAKDFYSVDDINWYELDLCSINNNEQNTSFHAANELAGFDERQRVIIALERCGYVQAKAARYMGLSVRQLGYRILKYNIPVKRF